MQVEPHVFAIIKSCDAANVLAELLPDCDIADELKYILTMQHQILLEMIQGRHFGSKMLEHFNMELDETLRNVEIIKKN